MCPSYLATRDEKDSTRGRARVLQEMVNGAPAARRLGLGGGARGLDLCLSCKGCASDCPTGIDMATYKAEVLHQRYRGRLRPRSHYALGVAAPLAAAARPPRRCGQPGDAQVGCSGRQRRGGDRQAARGARVRRLGRCVAGPDGTRRRDRPRAAPPAPRHDVVLWADSFTDRSPPTSAGRRRRVLEAAGLRVGVVGRAPAAG